jgi:hypothetical protein
LHVDHPSLSHGQTDAFLAPADWTYFYAVQADGVDWHGLALTPYPFL